MNLFISDMPKLWVVFDPRGYSSCERSDITKHPEATNYKHLASWRINARTANEHPDEDCLFRNIMETIIIDSRAATNTRCSRDKLAILFGRQLLQVCEHIN